MPCELITRLQQGVRADWKGLFFQSIMLDQQRLGLAGCVGDPSDDDPKRPAIFVSMRLDRLAPAPVEQDTCRRHARSRWHGLLADDPSQHLDT